MTAINKSIPLFDGFVKAVVSFVAFIYLVGIFWYPSIKYAVIDIAFILGLCFRFSYVINSELPKWKAFTSLFIYIVVMLDQAFDVVLANGSLSKVLTSSAVILVLPLIFAFFLDLWQFKKTRPVE